MTISSLQIILHHPFLIRPGSGTPPTEVVVGTIGMGSNTWIFGRSVTFIENNPSRAKLAFVARDDHKKLPLTLTDWALGNRVRWR